MTPLGSPTGRGVFSEVDGDETGTSRTEAVEVEGVGVGVEVTSGGIDALVVSCGRSTSLPTNETTAVAVPTVTEAETADDVRTVRSALTPEAVVGPLYCYIPGITSKNKHVM
jgi:hypothetical protein